MGVSEGEGIGGWPMPFVGVCGRRRLGGRVCRALSWFWGYLLNCSVLWVGVARVVPEDGWLVAGEEGGGAAWTVCGEQGDSAGVFLLMGV